VTSTAAPSARTPSARFVFLLPFSFARGRSSNARGSGVLLRRPARRVRGLRRATSRAFGPSLSRAARGGRFTARAEPKRAARARRSRDSFRQRPPVPSSVDTATRSFHEPYQVAWPRVGARSAPRARGFSGDARRVDGAYRFRDALRFGAARRLRKQRRGEGDRSALRAPARRSASTAEAAPSRSKRWSMPELDSRSAA
jgi:hypothetical protein